MQSEIIISNKSWFRNYSLIRFITILSVVVLFLVPNYLDQNLSFFANYLGVVMLPLLFVIIAFDYFQKPSFIEIEKSSSGLILRQYKPDVRFLFFYQESRVNTRILKQDEKLNCKFIDGVFPLLNQMELYISGPDANQKSEPINIAWMNDDQVNRLQDEIG